MYRDELLTMETDVLLATERLSKSASKRDKCRDESLLCLPRRDVLTTYAGMKFAKDALLPIRATCTRPHS